MYTKRLSFPTQIMNNIPHIIDSGASVMEDKPVAWFEQDPDMKSIWYQSEQDNPNAIPLYTHPAKTLTDEEIEECFEESCTDFKLLENGKTKGVVNIIDVGRAILRKAQEK